MVKYAIPTEDVVLKRVPSVIRYVHQIMSDRQSVLATYSVNQRALAKLFVDGFRLRERIQELLLSLPENLPPEMEEEAARLRREFQEALDVQRAIDPFVIDHLSLDPNDRIAVDLFIRAWNESGFVSGNKEVLQ